jgi:lysophospholipase L1-like esterase
VIPWRRSIRPAEQVRAINAWLKAYARREHLTYVDYYAALSDEDGGLPAKYSQDGVHPNHAAYLVMESLATRALTRRGGP